MEQKFLDIKNAFDSLKGQKRKYKDVKNVIDMALNGLSDLARSDSHTRAQCRAHIMDIINMFLDWLSRESGRPPSACLLKFLLWASDTYKSEFDILTRERVLYYATSSIPFLSASTQFVALQVIKYLFQDPLPSIRNDRTHAKDVMFLGMLGLNIEKIDLHESVASLIEIMYKVLTKGAGYYSRELLHILSTYDVFWHRVLRTINLAKGEELQTVLRFVAYAIGKYNKDFEDCHLILRICLQYGLLGQLQKFIEDPSTDNDVINIVATIFNVMIRDGQHSALLHANILNSLYNFNHENVSIHRVIDELENLF